MSGLPKRRAEGPGEDESDPKRPPTHPFFKRFSQSNSAPVSSEPEIIGRAPAYLKPIGDKLGRHDYPRLMKDGLSIGLEKGYRYAGAANVCPLEDGKVVLEDMSADNIVTNASTSAFAAEGDELLTEPAESIADGEIRRFKTFNCTVEIFRWKGFMVYRETNHELNSKVTKAAHYSKSATARHYVKLANEKFPNMWKRPKLVVVQHVMAGIQDAHGSMHDKSEEHIKLLAAQAHLTLYEQRDDPTFERGILAEIEGKVALTEGRKRCLTEIRSLYTEDQPNKYHELVADECVAEVCEMVNVASPSEMATSADMVTPADISIVRDENCRSIVFLITEAVQKMLPEGTLTRMGKQVDSFFWLYPRMQPDKIRHPTNGHVHLKENPEKDVTVSSGPHHANCTTEHVGCHTPIRQPLLEFMCFQKMHQSTSPPNVSNSRASREELSKLLHGSMAGAEKMGRLILDGIDQTMYKDYLAIESALPEEFRLRLATTGDNIYTYAAILVDVHTEGHTDSGDFNGGRAQLTCFGDFTGGDLVFKELGTRMKFPPGSVCFLRGHELHHSILRYKGKRYCFVLDNHESIRKLVKRLVELADDLRETKSEWTEATTEELHSFIISEIKHKRMDERKLEKRQSKQG